jgi:hypothetical protein
MPSYTFLNIKSEQVEEHTFPIRDYDSFIQKNPHLVRHHLPGHGYLGDPVRLGITGTDSGFKEVLSKIAENNYKSNLKDKLSRN